MNKYSSTTVLLPTKNHEDIIKKEINKLLIFMDSNFVDYEILVVSNGSEEQKINMLNDEVFSHSNINVKILEKLGKGNAVKWGLQNSKFNKVIIFDSDFSYDLNIIHKFFHNNKPLSSFIYAERQLNKKIINTTPKLRLIAGYIFNYIVRRYFKLSIHDTQAGLKFINLDEFKNAANFLNEGYLYDIELFLLAEKSKLEISKVKVFEINTNFESNISIFSDSLIMLKNLKQIKKRYS